jgi:hypothetical protein
MDDTEGRSATATHTVVDDSVLSIAEVIQLTKSRMVSGQNIQ